VLVDLRLLLTLRRLVDGELDATISIRHHLRHQRRVLGRDRLVVERDDLREPEYVSIELDPLVHRAKLDVADAVVDVFEPDRRRARIRTRFGDSGPPASRCPRRTRYSPSRLSGMCRCAVRWSEVSQWPFQSPARCVAVSATDNCTPERESYAPAGPGSDSKP